MLVAERGLDHDFLQYGAVVERDSEGIGDRPFGWVVVGGGEKGVFDAGDAPAEGFDEGGGGGFGAIEVVSGDKAVVDEHGGYHVLVWW